MSADLATLEADFAAALEAIRSPKMRRFVELYAGNGTRAAGEAGYSGSDKALSVAAVRLMKDERIKRALAARRAVGVAKAERAGGGDGEETDDGRLERRMLAILDSDDERAQAQIAASRELRQILNDRRRHDLAMSGGDVLERLRAKVREELAKKAARERADADRREAAE